MQVAAQAGYQVNMVDLNQEFIKKGENIILSSLERIARKKFAGDAAGHKQFIDEIMSRITLSTDSSKAASESQLIVEAIVENLQTKKTLFKTLDEAAPQNAIFASNTSSLPIADIAAATSRKDRFAGLHFFNPVPQMKLVEIIRIPETTDEVFNTLVDLTKKMGKVPVACKDTPG